MKKFIFLSLTALLSVSLFLAGCGDPETGPAGTSGSSGNPGYPVVSSGALGNTQWDQLFIGNDKVRLITGVSSITGTIPAGKTLEVAGTVPVADTSTLTVKGTVHILETGSVTSGSSTNIELDGGSLKVDGSVFGAGGLFPGGNSLAAGVSFGAKGFLDAGSGNAAAVNMAFSLGVPRVQTTATTVLDDLTALPDWTAGKTLITGGAITPSGNLNLAAVAGNLVIASTLTLDNSEVLTASTGGNVTVSETGGIVLGSAGASLAGKIKVYGGIGTNSVLTTAIPATVDLSEGTIGSTADTASFKFPAEDVTIGSIALTTNSITITGATGLTVVDTISNSAAKTLTLPAGTVTVKRIATHASNALTIAGAAGTIVRPALVTGSGGTGSLAVGANVVLNGDISLVNTITLNGLANLGANAAAQLTQLGKITGGEVATTVAVDFTAATTVKTKLTTTGVVTISENTRFNAGASLTNVANVLKDGKKLIVGGGAPVSLGANLALGTGVYAAAGDVTLNGTAGSITTAATAEKGLTVTADGASTTNYFSLTTTAASAATFVATASNTAGDPVVFSAAGISIPANTGANAGAKLTAGTAGGANKGKITVRGTPDIALGVKSDATQAGSLVLIDGAILDVGAGFAFGTAAGAGIRLTGAETSGTDINDTDLTISGTAPDFTVTVTESGNAGAGSPAIIGKVSIAGADDALTSTSTAAGTAAAGSITAAYSGASDDTTLTFAGPAS
ncbi:MAG: hypothetical protein LBT00_03535 [Spirochaetaceae bacterium]|jgi:filamentous hemagglutinin|nr:hypothetical protein [Spirochaetaceae bacterium]